MTVNERHFLGFIRYALLGGDYPHGILTRAGWQEQQKMAKNQTVTGLLYTAVSQLPPDLRPPQEMMMKLYSKVVYLENMNRMLNERTCQIFKIYKEMGYHPILLKGQEVATLYDRPELRAFGDIDIFVPDWDMKINDWVFNNAERVENIPGKDHLVAFNWNGAMVENHLCLLKFYNKSLARKMEEIVKAELNEDTPLTFVTINSQKIEVLPRTLELLYQIVHFSKHLILSGVGLRQLCDITLTIHRYHDVIDAEKLCQWFDMLEIRQMANAIAAAAVRYLGLPSEEVPYDYHEDNFGEKEDDLMDIVMDAANFGYWLKLGKRRSWWQRTAKNLRQYARLYPYMPKETRTEMWLSLIGRLK